MLDMKSEAFACIERNAPAIATVGDSIFAFAEVAMQEFETCQFLCQVLKDIGFAVETGISGFPTAILATYGSGQPVIAVHTEYDALPGVSQAPGVTERKQVVPGAPGHAEGHNCGSALAMGALFAVKQAMDQHQLSGTIKFFGVPAEELVLARPFFVRDGYFDDVDAAIWCHLAANFENSYGVRNYGNMSVEFEFFGKTAHASTSPWSGVSAVDAVKLMDIGWDVLREHLPPTQRSHSVILNGGSQPNVVPDYARIWYMFRESTGEGVKNLYEKAKQVAAGAAMMTGCQWQSKVNAAVWPGRDSRALSEIIQANIDLVGLPQWSEEEMQLAKQIQRAAGVPEVGLSTEVSGLAPAVQGTHSNDSGDITWVVPHGKVQFPSNVPGVPFHHWCAGIAPATSIGHKGEVAGAKVLAGTLLDLLSQPELVEKVHACFDEENKGVSYEPLLPLGTTPPLEQNKAIMESYRPAMRQYYLNQPVKFVP
jgi:aminobenzoyl-glutamate utilization protein B